jgi:hypothetical protein
MDTDAVRIVPTDEGPGMLPIEDVHDARGRARPPVSVVVVMVLSTVGLLWMFNQRLEPEPVEFRTVYSVPGWEPTFESVKEFLPQPQVALGYTWSLVALLTPEFGTIEAGSDVRMVIGGGQGLVAVGSSSSSAAVWSSVDGAIWSRVLDVADASGTGDDRWMSAVVVGGPGLVAVGGERLTVVDPSGVPIDDDRDDDAAVWTSVDGSVWTRVPHDEEVFGLARLWTVVAGGPGLVAFGDDLQQEVVGEGNAVGVWVSRDGLNWSRVPVDESVFAGATVGNVVTGGPGLVAVGHTGLDEYYYTEPDEESDAVVWVSLDGISWTRVPHDESVFGGDGRVAMHDVTVGGPGLVAVGSGEQRAIMWTSRDGLVWTRVPHDESTFGLDAPPVDFGIDPVTLDDLMDDARGWGVPAMLSMASGEENLIAVEGRLIAVSADYFLFNGNEVWTGISDEE